MATSDTGRSIMIRSSKFSWLRASCGELSLRLRGARGGFCFSRLVPDAADRRVSEHGFDSAVAVPYAVAAGERHRRAPQSQDPQADLSRIGWPGPTADGKVYGRRQAAQFLPPDADGRIPAPADHVSGAVAGGVVDVR